MGLLWPWAILSPLNPLRAAEYFDTFFEKPWKELYAGTLFAVPDMPVSYLPNLFALKLPELMLALVLSGMVGALVAATRRSVPLNRRAALLTVVLAALLPLAIAMLMRPALYNGLRHFVFVVPPLAVLGGLAAAWLIERAQAYGKAAAGAALAIFIAGIAIPVTGMARLHPYEYTWFNSLAGGVPGAAKNYMLDYWGLAFKQAADELHARIAAGSLQPPKGRRWVVAICGPQAPAQVELGPQFETEFDEKNADFAMALGTFYCRRLPAPILAEVRREGVTYALVYDLRGGPMPNLLTTPPP
jgi:hypothetical protein